MKRNIHHPLIVMAALLSFASCDVKDPIYNTSHPEHGKVTLTTDWSGIGEELTAPANYQVTAGDYSATLSGVTNVLDHLFTPGKYSFYIYNMAEHVTISGTTATVSEASGNVTGAGRFIRNTPGWLFTSIVDARIERDKDHSYFTAMQQQVRQLTLIIEPTGGTIDRIERIEGYLSGAASSLNFADSTHTAPMNVELHFSRIASGPNAGKWAATVRLLGTAGTQQKLSAQIHFAGGSPAAVNFDSDLTTALATFNADKRTPLTLGGSVVETPTGAGFGSTITGWTPVKGGWVTAD